MVITRAKLSERCERCIKSPMYFFDPIKNKKVEKGYCRQCYERLFMLSMRDEYNSNFSDPQGRRSDRVDKMRRAVRQTNSKGRLPGGY